MHNLVKESVLYYAIIIEKQNLNSAVSPLSIKASKKFSQVHQSSLNALPRIHTKPTPTKQTNSIGSHQFL